MPPPNDINQMPPPCTDVTLGFFFRSPHNTLGMDDMDLSNENLPNIDIMDEIDVRQILGLNDDFLPPNQTGSF